MLSASLRLEAYKHDGFWYLSHNDQLAANRLADVLEANCADCDAADVVISCDGKRQRDYAGDTDGGYYREQVLDFVAVIARQVQLSVQRDGKWHAYVSHSTNLLRECESEFESELMDLFAA